MRFETSLKLESLRAFGAGYLHLVRIVTTVINCRALQIFYGQIE